jgi:hypothetical protein
MDRDASCYLKKRLPDKWRIKHKKIQQVLYLSSWQRAWHWGVSHTQQRGRTTDQHRSRKKLVRVKKRSLTLRYLPN